MDEILRREVRFLTTRLGAIAREQAGEATFHAIENLRQSAKKLRQHPSAEQLDANDRQVRQLTLGRAADVAHAFSLFFHLVNLCEERQRVRRLRAYEASGQGAPMSLQHTFSELARYRVPPDELLQLLRGMRVEPVLTAHPTEAKRRSVLNHVLRIGASLNEHAGFPPHLVERYVDPWIEALWLTDEVRERSVTPELEIENSLVFLDRTIYSLAGTFWEKFCDELSRFSPQIEVPKPFLRFGSWVGTDRDGNPNVTPETSLKAASLLRQSILAYYRQALRRMLGVISFPSPREIERRIRRELSRDTARFPATRWFQALDQPHEYYRRKIRVMLWRIERTTEGERGSYANVEDFERDLETLEGLLAEHPSPRVARLGPRRLRVTAQVFGFHAASLDFRQHTSLVNFAAAEILRAGKLPGEPYSERIRSIQKLFRGGPRGLKLPAPARATLEEFSALREIQSRFGHEASHRYILSMTRSAADVWDALLVGWQAGLVRWRRGRLESSFDVIPLFETLEDLETGPRVLDELLSDKVYRDLLRSRDDFQEVMLGYSDSVKDGGYFAANFALLRAQKRLWEVAEKHGVRLGLFHGKGGTIGRGGGQSHRSVQAQPYAAPGGRIRITEQGEVISLKYANLEIAERNMEQLVTSVLDALLLDPRRKPQERRLAEWESHAGEMAETSTRFYRELVYETPGFAEFFRQATPIDLIEGLRLGSRPSRRSHGGDLRELRAIPWVFAWTQSRHFIPAWYGLGHALETFVAQRENGMELLREMYRGWPFFALLIDNAEASLAKSDLYIARRYEALCKDEGLREKFSKLIEQEFDRSVRAVLAVTQSSRLLERQPVLEESIRLRNPYVDPLNFLQIRFLEEWRRAWRPKPELLHLLQITVGGIAFGMKSTG
ncbi:MAG TPA: phosphoenolpyruvate carboxylase [Terriglobia bacterium]|nr:phosphoenolpyruvate carboxylase [Terriglobia bacterium]